MVNILQTLNFCTVQEDYYNFLLSREQWNIVGEEVINDGINLLCLHSCGLKFKLEN